PLRHDGNAVQLQLLAHDRDIAGADIRELAEAQHARSPGDLGVDRLPPRPQAAHLIQEKRHHSIRVFRRLVRRRGVTLRQHHMGHGGHAAARVAQNEADARPKAVDCPLLVRRPPDPVLPQAEGYPVQRTTSYCCSMVWPGIQMRNKGKSAPDVCSWVCTTGHSSPACTAKAPASVANSAPTISHVTCGGDGTTVIPCRSASTLRNAEPTTLPSSPSVESTSSWSAPPPMTPSSCFTISWAGFSGIAKSR